MPSNNNKDNEVAIICSSLKGNTKLGTLDICVSGLTIQGAHDLATGIRQSKLTAIAFSGEADNHFEVMRILYREGIMQAKTIQGLNMVAALGDVDAFVDTLSSLKRLKIWSSAIEKESTVQLGFGLTRNKSIQELSVFFDNQSHELVTLLLSSFAERTKRLTKLHLRGECEAYSSNLAVIDSGSGAVSLFFALKTLFDAAKEPTELEILNCEAPEEQWDQFCRTFENPACSLESLSIINSTITVAKARSLGGSLKHNTSLKKLRLFRNQLGDSGLTELSTGLAGNTSLKTLQLVNNRIGDNGVFRFVQSCTPKTPIQHLDLTNNVFGPVGAKTLVTAAASLVSLQRLNLANNENIGVSGLMHIGECLSQLKLKSLNVSVLSSWEAPSAGTLLLKNDAYYDAAGQALVKGLQANYHLHELCVSHIHLSPKIRHQIQLYTNLNKCGRRLLADESGLPPTLWCHVLAKCESKHSLLYYFVQQKPELFMAV
jgi:hypothetical protein